MPTSEPTLYGEPRGKKKSLKESAKSMARGFKEIMWDSLKSPVPETGSEIGFCGKKGKPCKKTKKRKYYGKV